MTKTQKATAIITGSYIMYLIDSLLDKSEHFHLTTIRLKQSISAQTRKAQNRNFVILSNKAWSSVVDVYKDKNMHIAIFDAVESLAFDQLDLMTEMFGSNFINYVNGFTQKQTRDGVSREILLQSREVTSALKKAVQKVCFDNKEVL